MRRICILTGHSLNSNPRVVKEADTLSAAGFDVRVVACQTLAWMPAADETLLRARPWTCKSLRFYPEGLMPRIGKLRTGARHKCYRLLAEHATLAHGIAERAFSRFHAELAREAIRERADLYVGHTLEALAPAFHAARTYSAALGFDSEDFHSGEADDAAPRGLKARLIDFVERRYLGACDYVTAASVPMAHALAALYGLKPVTAVHNVFPWADRQSLDGRVQDRRGPELSVYWFSQVVGLDRGLQDCIRAAGQVRARIQVHIRGALPDPAVHELRQLAREHGVDQRVFFHPPVHPDELLSRAAEHDVGLALEPPTSANRRVTVANKYFLYMLAGLAVGATSTQGQRSAFEQTPEIGFLFESGNYRALAAELQRLADDAELLRMRKRAALAAAETLWNWEREGEKLVALVERTLGDFEGRATARR